MEVRYVQGNSLAPGDAMSKKLVNIGACYGIVPDGTRPDHRYQLKQCWLIMHEVSSHSSESDLTGMPHVSITKMRFKITHLKLQPKLPGTLVSIMAAAGLTILMFPALYLGPESMSRCFTSIGNPIVEIRRS